MYAVSGDIVKVNLSVAVPKASRDSFCLAGEDIGAVLGKRVMMFDETQRAVMAVTPYRALCSALNESGRWIPNTSSGLVEIAKIDWEQRKGMLQANKGKVSITRTGYTMEGTTTDPSSTSSATVTLGGKLQDLCWSPLLTGFMTNHDTVWAPASLAALEPPENSLCVMETELELLRAEFAWLKSNDTGKQDEPQRIVQCFGGLGGLWTPHDSTATLVGGGKFYSPMYAAANPGAVLFLAQKQEEATEGQEEEDTTEPVEKKGKVED